VGLRSGPSDVDPRIAVVRPAQLLKHLPEGRKVGLSVRIVRSRVHDYANAPHPLWLLCASRERPRNCAAEECDECAAFHCLMPPVLSTERIAHIGTAGDCCAAGFQLGLCPLWVLVV